jgi:hypothetical protein
MVKSTGVPLLLGGKDPPFFGPFSLKYTLLRSSAEPISVRHRRRNSDFITNCRKRPLNPASIWIGHIPRSLIMQISSRKYPYSINRTDPYATAR